MTDRNRFSGRFWMIALSLLLLLVAAPSVTASAEALDTHGAATEPAGATMALPDTDTPTTGRFVAAPPIMPGWPQTMGIAAFFSPVGVVLADVDDNGDLEVLAGSTDGLFRVWEHDGTLLPGWPQSVGGQVQAKPAAADLDGDGDLEILVPVKTGVLRIYHHDGTPLPGWPQATGVTFGFVAPSVYDLDDDGRPEILIGGGSDIQAWNADGTLVSGFPVPVTGTITGTLAIGDVTGDPSPEIFAVTTNPGMLHAANSDGTVPSGWPFALGLSTSWAAPSIGDVDQNGDREVLVVGYQFGTSSTIYALRGNGSVLFSVTYPSVQTYSCPVVADIDGNGFLELFNAGKVVGNTFYAWDHTGSLLPGWPTPAASNMEGSAIVADFDGDGSQETVIGDNFSPGLFFGYEADGSPAPDFPFPKPAASLPNAPEVADVDQDGDLDMAMTMSDGQVALWDFAVPYDRDLVEWGGLFHDNWNTNQYGFRVPGGGTTAIELDPAEATVLPTRLALYQNQPNPFNPETHISFDLAESGRVTLTIYDAAGRSLRTLVDGPMSRDTHTIHWDGRDEHGRSVGSGVYLYELRAEGRTLKQKMVLVK